MSHPHVEHELLHGEHPHAYDRREPNYKFLLPFSFVCFLLFVAIFWGVAQYYDIFREDLIQERVLGPQSEELQAVRAREDQELGSYGTVDKEHGLIRIPIERAMQLVAADAAAGQPKYNTKSISVKSAVAIPVAPAQPAAAPPAGGPPAQ